MTGHSDITEKTQSIIDEFDLPYLWPKAVTRQLTTVSDTVSSNDIKNRKDLRKLPFITIDGESARDFDDAVYCYRKNDCFYLTVAIADVSHYVPVDSALDKEAFNRSNSVYFEHRVIPMLPEELSNRLCSLNPAVDRLVLAVEMQINFEGVVESYQFCDGVIHSQSRLTYNQVNDYLISQQADFSNSVKTNIDELHNVYQCLVNAREQRGAMEFEMLDTQIILNKNNKVKSIVPIVRNDAHKLIEEAMLAANYCAADLLLQQKQPGLFRNHLPPEMEKLASLRLFLQTQGLMLTGGDKPHSGDFQLLGKQVKNCANAQVIYNMMLRAQQQAYYSPDNEGHFGLGLRRYTHFTSPIRRYSDLVVHRSIRKVTQNQSLEAIGEQCSTNERKAEEATRVLTQWLKCQYLQHHVGSTFKGSVTSVTAFGLFVTLDQLFIDGLVHISNLGKDFYNYNANEHLIVGRRNGKTYRMGQVLEVQVASVNLEGLKIDFTLVNQLKTQPKPVTKQRIKNNGKYRR